jgi:hypothetical protein
MLISQDNELKRPVGSLKTAGGDCHATAASSIILSRPGVRRSGSYATAGLTGQQQEGFRTRRRSDFMESFLSGNTAFAIVRS